MKMMKTKGYSKGGKMNTKGYAKGGKLEMVEKGGKKVPFYAADGKGKMAEGGEVAKEKKSTKTMNVPGKLQSKTTSQKAKEAKAKAKAKAKKNNTTDAKAKTAIEQLMGGAGSGAGGMGATPSMQSAGGAAKMGRNTDRTMTPRKPMGMPGMKSGGKVKKSKTKGYAKGGKVRGAGIAKKGVKPCKMR
jgi:hypothetical protein